VQIKQNPEIELKIYYAGRDQVKDEHTKKEIINNYSITNTEIINAINEIYKQISMLIKSKNQYAIVGVLEISIWDIISIAYLIIARGWNNSEPKLVQYILCCGLFTIGLIFTTFFLWTGLIKGSFKKQFKNLDESVKNLSNF
jgi:hypothetical protein